MALKICSRHFQHLLGTRNVFQNKGYLSVISEWSSDTLRKFYRHKMKSFHFLQKDTLIRASVNPQKRGFSAWDWFSNRPRNFFSCNMTMFKVFKRCACVRAFERTNSHYHTTITFKKIWIFRFFWKKKPS